MLQVVIVGIVIGVIIVLMQISGRWTSAQMTHDLVARLKAGESIVNHRQIPEAWLLPHRKRIADLRQAGKDQAEIERAGAAALKDCLNRFDRLIAFFEKTNVANNPDTRRILMARLREERTRWASASWQALLTPDDVQPPQGEHNERPDLR
jgi:hypothetical protein